MRGGARPLRRALEHYLEDPLSEELLRGNFDGKDVVTVRPGSGGRRKEAGLRRDSVPRTPERVAAGESNK